MIFHSKLTGHTFYETTNREIFILKTKDFKKNIERWIKDENKAIKTYLADKKETENGVERMALSYSDKQNKLWYGTMVHDVLIKMSEKRISQLESVLREIPTSTSNIKEWTGDIDEARKVPITKFIEFRGGKVRCLWHQEKTPSMHYNSKINKVHCFGKCNESHSVIDVVMKLYGYTLPEAIKFLTQK